MKYLFVLISIVLMFVAVAAAPVQASPPNNQPVTVEFLAAVAGALLSLLFSYFPRLNDWYASISPNGRRFVMLASLAVVAFGGVYGLSCIGIASQYGVPVVECSRAGLLDVVKVFIFALIANQSTFSLTPKAPETAPRVTTTA